jgi:hypothetical protein
MCCITTNQTSQSVPAGQRAGTTAERVLVPATALVSSRHLLSGPRGPTSQHQRGGHHGSRQQAAASTCTAAYARDAAYVDTAPPRAAPRPVGRHTVPPDGGPPFGLPAGLAFATPGVPPFGTTNLPPSASRCARRSPTVFPDGEKPHPTRHFRATRQASREPL